MGNKLLINRKYIEIQCSRDDWETQSLASQIPYAHSNRTKTKFRTTSRNIALVLKLFRNIDETNVDSLPPNIREIWENEMHRQAATKTLLEQGPQRPSGWLYAHQQLGRELAEIHDRYAFFYDRRTGKTPMSLQIIADDIAKNPDHRWLVICPLILIENAWLPDAAHFFPELKVVNLHDRTKANRLKKFQQDANLYIINIESFVNYRKYIDKLNIHGCFVDESSAMKSSRSKFGKEVVDYAQTLERWYLLSGTPAPNGEWEYYRQLQSIDYYGVHQSWTQFKNYFFDNISYNPQFEKLQVKEHRRDELMQLIRRYSIYVDKEDVLNTPGRDFITVDITMPKELTKQYNQLRRELYIELMEGDILVTAPSAGAKRNKLNQVTSGFIIDTKSQEAYLLSDYRFKALSKLLHNIGDEQVIIWCNYHKEFEAIQDMLGDKCASVYGKVSIEDKNKNIKAFKEGKVQYLVANPASADKGLTLTNTRFAIYFSMNDSLELFEQSADRIYGDISKQAHRCTYYIIQAKGTIDEVIYRSIRNKENVSMAILKHLKGGIQ
jgi:hypothetical protein